VVDEKTVMFPQKWSAKVHIILTSTNLFYISLYLLSDMPVCLKKICINLNTGMVFVLNSRKATSFG
jgi:hypothetical protein